MQAMKEYPKLKDSSNLKNLEESMKQEKLVSFLGDECIPNKLNSTLNHTKEFDDFLYNEYYLKRHSYGLGADGPLRAINEFYGTKVFVPAKTTDDVADDILREFHAWNKASEGKVNWETTLSFDDYDPYFYTALNGQGAGGYASHENFIRIRGNYTKIIENYPIMRHERLHRQDFLRTFGYFGKNKKYDFTEGSKILKEKQWYRDEFRNAGIPECDIDYAYTNRKEFIAVAAQGDHTKYSDEFKQVLVDLGMPDWFFTIRKFKSYNA